MSEHQEHEDIDAVWVRRDSPGARSRVRVLEQRGFGHF
ncbi:hypothetical protein BN159_p117 (plasmid) [Streptomyces davaonensis JCM 4913]|uniref:Uncharacterized protein n=1 Tax=Streptomyces davaonensis (strain DSM 101723 / JCM 4913 / KCC S-0913 / 768) TaxID=1214101 RepID=K4R9N3_STRDJ|nr:hypothetical protein BN159_p117 [Streptomyces davaonensis JCM 4913]